MRDGKITQAGKYNDILNSGTDFRELVDAHREALSSIKKLEKNPTVKGINTSANETDSAGEFELEEQVETKDVQDEDDKGGLKGQLVQEEEREKGKVGFDVYWKYITAAYGGALVLFILFLLVLFQVFQIGSNYWMAWAAPVSETSKPPVGRFTLLLVYVVLAIGSCFCNLARTMLSLVAGYKTANTLFNKLHMCFFRAPMSYLDSTPSGRILNRVCQNEHTTQIHPMDSCPHTCLQACVWHVFMKFYLFISYTKLT